MQVCISYCFDSTVLTVTVKKSMGDLNILRNPHPTVALILLIEFWPFLLKVDNSSSDQHEFDPTPGGNGRQAGLACSGPWGHEEFTRHND